MLTRLRVALRRLFRRCECCGARAEFMRGQHGWLRNWCSECKFAVHPTCWCSRRPYTRGGTS